MGQVSDGRHHHTRNFMTTSITTARKVLEAHGFTLSSWAGYTIRRDIPPYGSRCPKGKGFHRDWRSFHATNVSLKWVRRLADALAMADAHAVTSGDCADAWAADRKAADAWEEAGRIHREACSFRRPDFTLNEKLDLEVQELKTGGASRVAQLCAQVLLEEWQIWHPISETIAAIDRGRQPVAA